jgi:ribonuclease VapC
VIVVDTSALMALLLSEPCGDAVADALAGEEQLVIAAGTLGEASIVAGRRGLSEEMDMLLSGVGTEVDNLSASDARAVAAAHSVWGKGVHPASLNFGDCFAYICAKSHDAPLLFVGDDFSRTDVASALKS